MNLRVFFYIYLFINFVVVCVCVCVAFFALTLWYILLSFPFYSIRWFIHVIVHVHALINESTEVQNLGAIRTKLIASMF